MDEFEEFEEFFKPITSTQVQTDCPHCRIKLMQTETGLMCYTCGFVTGETVLVSTFKMVVTRRSVVKNTAVWVS